MPQVTIYLDSETELRLRTAAERAGISRSRWVAELIRGKTARTWPETVRELAGSWRDFPSLDELRKGQGEDVSREHL
jgi:hypothetical protein